MGRRGIVMPSEREVPPCPRRDLVLAVHELYRAAGWPAARRIGAQLKDGEYPGTMNHEMVSQFIRGRTLSTLLPVRSLAMLLAELCTPARNPQEESDRIGELWQAAMVAPRLPQPQPDESDRRDRAPSTSAPPQRDAPAGRVPQQRPAVPRRGTTARPTVPPSGTAARPTVPARSTTVRPTGVRTLLAADIAALADARTAHGGLSIGQVEELASRIVDALTTSFTDQIKQAELPLSISASATSGTLGDLPYRSGPGNSLLKIQGIFPRPQVRIEITPLVGIAQNRDAEYAYAVIDANVPQGAPLFLTLDEVLDRDSLAAPGGRLDQWVEGRIHNRLTHVILAARNDVRGWPQT